MNVIQAKEYLVRLNTNDDNVFYLITLLDYFLTGKVPENNEAYKLFNDELRCTATQLDMPCLLTAKLDKGDICIRLEL